MGLDSYGQGVLPSEPNEIENEGWLAVKLRKKINKKWSLRLRTEARIIEDKNDQFFIEPSVKFKISKNLNFIGGYRISIERKNSLTLDKNRANIGFIGHGDIHDINLSVRLLYTDRIDVQGFGVGGNKIRVKVNAEYELIKDKLTPFVGVELFRELGLPTLEKIRYIGGLEYELTKRYALNVSFRYEDFFDEATIANIGTLSLKYKL